MPSYYVYNDEIYIETCLSDLYNNMNLSCR